MSGRKRETGLHFRGHGQASELVSGAVGGRHGVDLPPRPLPWPSLSEWNQHRGVPRETQGGRVLTGPTPGTGQPSVNVPLTHPETCSELWALDLPGSCVLACEMRREVSSGFSKGFG